MVAGLQQGHEHQRLLFDNVTAEDGLPGTSVPVPSICRIALLPMQQCMNPGSVGIIAGLRRLVSCGPLAMCGMPKRLQRKGLSLVQRLREKTAGCICHERSLI